MQSTSEKNLSLL